MFLLDYLRQRWQPKGSIVAAGVPPEARPANMAVDHALVERHLHARVDLPHAPELADALVAALSDASAIQYGARAIADRLVAQLSIAIAREPLVELINVVLAELARRMYIEAARSKPGAIGIRVIAEPGVHDANVIKLTARDEFGLGAGVYPFDQVPQNPAPGRRCGFYIRVVQSPTV